MATDKITLLLFDNYLSNEMNKNDRAVFEKRLLTDISFNKKFAQYKKFYDAFDENAALFAKEAKKKRPPLKQKNKDTDEKNDAGSPQN